MLAVGATQGPADYVDETAETSDKGGGITTGGGASLQSQCRYGRVEPSPGADVARVSPVSAHMWQWWAQSACGCRSSGPSPDSHVAGFSTHYPQPAYQFSAVQAYVDEAKDAPTGKPQPHRGTGPGWVWTGYTRLGSTEPAGMYRAGWDAHAGKFNRTNRAYPDVALIGKNYNVQIGGFIKQVCGTSASAPVVAAMISLANVARRTAGKSALGFINPWLYNNSAVASDITVGRNNCCAGMVYSEVCCPDGYSAAKGWDPLTGLGSLNFKRFLAAVNRG